MSRRKQLYCLEYRFDERESFEVAETLIANAVHNARQPLPRLGIGLDIVATPAQMRAGAARTMADHLLAYMDQHFPALFAAYVGLTDNPNRLPMRGLTTGRLSEDDLDGQHLLVLGGERPAPAAAAPDSIILPDQNVVYWGDLDRAFIEIIGVPVETANLPARELDKRRQRGPLRAAFIPDPIASVVDVLFNHPMIWRTGADLSAAVAGQFSRAEAQAFTRQMQLRAGWLTFIGIDQRETSADGFLIELRIAYPHDRTLWQALQAIEAVEYAKDNRLPAHLFAAIYAALTTLQQTAASRRSPGLPHVAAMTLARFCWRHAQECYFPEVLPAPLSHQRVAAMVTAVCEGLGLVSDDPETLEPELRPTDVGRVLVEAGHRLWQTDTLHDVVRSFQTVGAMVLRSTLADFNVLARVQLLARPRLSVEVAGLRLACDEPGEWFYAYLQVLEITASGLPTEAARSLLSDGRLPAVSGSGLEHDSATESADDDLADDDEFSLDSDEDTAFDEFDDQAAAPPMPPGLAGLAGDLQRLSAAPAGQTPVGLFELRLPPEVAWQALAGVERLTVYATSVGLWFRLRGEVSGLVGWTSDSPIRDWVLPGPVALELELLARALWADLRQAGLAVLPRVDGQIELPLPADELRLTGERHWLAQAGTTQARGLSCLLAGLS